MDYSLLGWVNKILVGTSGLSAVVFNYWAENL